MSSNLQTIIHTISKSHIPKRKRIQHSNLSIDEEDQGLRKMAPQRRWKGLRIDTEEVGNLSGEVCKLIRVERGDMGEEHGHVPEILG